MKYTIFIAVTCFSRLLLCQVNKFTSNTAWEGDVGSYAISESQLRLQANTAGNAVISSPILIKDTCVWRLSFELSFSPSTSNQFRFYFMANARVDSNMTEALYIEIGESGSEDGVSLYRVSGGKKTLISKLFAGEFVAPGVVNNLLLSKVADVFTLFVNDHEGYEFNLTVHDSVYSDGFVRIHNEFTKSNVSGFRMSYLYFGKQVYEDLSVKDLVFNSSKNKMMISYNQGLSGLVLDQIDVVNASSPFSYAKKNDVIEVEFQDDLEKEGLLRVNLVFKTVGDQLIRLQGEVWYYNVDPFDVIITEVMHDDVSNTGYLHEGQFVELYNRSSHPVDLGEIKLIVGDDSVPLPSFVLTEGEYVTLMKSNVLGGGYLKVLPVPSWKNLGLKEGKLSLFSNDVLIDNLHYNKDNFEGDFKLDGGWSIELNNVENYCIISKSWLFSEDKTGGTPGRKNSLNDNLHSDVIEINELYFENDNQITLELNVKLLLDKSNFVCELAIDSAVQHPTELNAFTIFFTERMLPGEVYVLTMNGVVACNSGLPEKQGICRFGIPKVVGVNDLVVNEILADANNTEGDYIELYNNSNKIVDLSEVLIGVFDDVGVLVDTHVITNGRKLIFPNDYLCLTKDEVKLKSLFYDVEKNDSLNIFSVEEMPNLPAESGRVGLMDRSGEVIDVVYYDASWHSDLIADKQGVSLERIAFNGGSSDPSNWNSATFESGYGTPGYANSNALNKELFQNEKVERLYLVNDYIDVNEIASRGIGLQYNGLEIGYALSGVVYNSKGEEVGVLCDNVSLGSSGDLFFDINMLPSVAMVPSVYIVFFEAIHPEYEKIKLKKSVSVF